MITEMKLASRMLLVLGLALIVPGCGGNDADGGGTDGAAKGPEMAFGVAIDQSSPEAAAVSYVKLVDTCEAEAARRAFRLAVQPKGLERETIETRVGRDTTLAEQTKLFESRGLCDDPNQAPPADIVTRVLKYHPVDNTPFPATTVLVSFDAETTPCEGSDSEALAVTEVEGVWKIDADKTGPLGGQSSLLASGCIQAAD